MTKITTLQRVAMAIGSGWLAVGSLPLNDERWNKLSDKLRTELTGEARLAVLAIRDPPQHILDAAEAEDDHTTRFVQAADAKTHWVAMIDAILAEGNG